MGFDKAFCLEVPKNLQDIRPTDRFRNIEFCHHLTTGEIADAVRRLRKRTRGTARSRRRGLYSG